MLRRCIPSQPIPLSSLENPIQFSLPVDQICRQTEDSASSSTKSSTVSDFSIQVTAHSDKGKQHNGNAEKEEGEMEGERVSTSVYNTSSSGLPDNNLAHYRCSRDPDIAVNNDNDLEKGTLGLDGPSHDVEDLDTDDISLRPSLLEQDVNADSDIDIDLELFRKFFPELDDFEEDLTSFHLSSLLPTSESFPSVCNPWIEPDSETNVAKPPVVVVPTAVQASESNTDVLNKSREGEMKSASSMTLFKTAANFVEEPAPQILGHVPPEKPELAQLKGLSVDRLVHVAIYYISHNLVSCA